MVIKSSSRGRLYYSAYYRIDNGIDVIEAFSDFKEVNYSYVLIAGGDGTIDNVVNAMAKSGVSVPIGILPVGTANDFGKFLGMPSNIELACRQTIFRVTAA